MSLAVSRFSQVILSVRSALMQCISVEVLRVGGCGSMISVSVREAMEWSERRAVAKACPRKPPAPVMRILAISANKRYRETGSPRWGGECDDVGVFGCIILYESLQTWLTT